MSSYNFKVVAELRDDLVGQQKKNALEKIEEYQHKYKVMKVDEVTYCAAEPIKGHDDFGAVTFFYCMLKRMKEVFIKLEYYDLGEGEKDVEI